MIVRRDEDRVVFVTQREHARLSAVLYGVLTDPLRPVEVAIRHHDDGWEEVDREPPVRGDSIPDYRSIPLGEHLGILRKSVMRSLSQHPYAGWLVSKHGCSFHEGKSGTAVEKFLEEQSNLRERLEPAIRDDLINSRSRDFDWLQFTDAISLYVLDPWSETLEWDRAVPGSIRVEPRSNRSYRVSEDLFSGDALSLAYSYRSLPKSLVRDTKTVRDELARQEYRRDSVRLSSEK